MVWALALCPDDAKQDPVVYSAKFGVVFLVKGLRTTSKQEGLDGLGLYRSILEGERYFRLVVDPTLLPPGARPAHADPPGNFDGHV